MSLDPTKTAGDDVESRCLKCKAVTNHTIIAMTGDTIAKVECRGCGGRHNYRAPEPEKKKAATTLRRRNGTIMLDSQGQPKESTGTSTGGRKISKGAVNFEALLKNKNVGAATPYAIDATLSHGILVDHTTFGLGVVTAIMPPNKAQVTFQEHGPKLLVCRLG